jgi:hypothetical protein
MATRNGKTTVGHLTAVKQEQLAQVVVVRVVFIDDGQGGHGELRD